MNATISNGGKVYRIIDGCARGGVGRNGKSRAWQMELGEVTCQRCVKFGKTDERKESSGGTPEPTRGTRVLQHD